MNKLLTILAIVIAMQLQAQETIEIDTTPKTKYAVLTQSEYQTFNDSISLVKGYKQGLKTVRVYPIKPQRFTMDGEELKVVITVNPANQLYCTRKLYDRNEIAIKDTVLTE